MDVAALRVCVELLERGGEGGGKYDQSCKENNRERLLHHQKCGREGCSNLKLGSWICMGKMNAIPTSYINHALHERARRSLN